MRGAEATAFAGGSLDRAAHLRPDPARLAALAASEAARCLPVWRGRTLLDGAGGLGWLAPGHSIFAHAREPAAFLGLDGGAPRFARDVDRWDGPPGVRPEAPPGRRDETRVAHPALPPELGFGDLRAAMAELAAAEAGTAAAAKALLGWHASHPFCARCGQPTAMADGGWRRACAGCGGQHFPRTDPVVIMLVTWGEDVLLGRQAAWPPGMYSLLAGFMEPGETVEAAVRRETFEEAGIRVGEVEYLASQPWPFPASLMLGCRGHALTREIRLDPTELEAALWLGREALLEAMAGRRPDLRPARKGAIARFLLERWVADRLR